MTNITQQQIDNLKKIHTIVNQSKLLECELCEYTSNNEMMFHEGICLMCCKTHKIDY